MSDAEPYTTDDVSMLEEAYRADGGHEWGSVVVSEDQLLATTRALEAVTDERDDARATVAELVAALEALRPPKDRDGATAVEMGFGCGRHYLLVAGTVVAMEGDVSRDSAFGRNWTKDDLKRIESKFWAPLEAALAKAKGGTK